MCVKHFEKDIKLTSSSSSSSSSLSSYWRLMSWLEYTCFDCLLLDLAPRFCFACRLTSNSAFLLFTCLDRNLNNKSYKYQTINIYFIISWGSIYVCILTYSFQEELICIPCIFVNDATRLIKVSSVPKHYLQIFLHLTYKEFQILNIY